jgi:hypothetical protein
LKPEKRLLADLTTRARRATGSRTLCQILEDIEVGTALFSHGNRRRPRSSSDNRSAGQSKSLAACSLAPRAYSGE